MGRKGGKIPCDVKVKYAKLCLEGKLGVSAAARELDVGESSVSAWVCRYQEQGDLAFLDAGRNHVYSDELRQKAVHSYLRGEGSLKEVSAKYGLRSRTQLSEWIKR